MTGGNSSKTTPNHSVFFLLPIHHGDVSESYCCHSIPRQPLDPTMNWRLLSCHLLSLPCLGVLRWITHSFLKKFRVGVLQHGMCHGIFSGLLKLMTHNGWKQAIQKSYFSIILPSLWFRICASGQELKD